MVWYAETPQPCDVRRRRRRRRRVGPRGLSFYEILTMQHF